MEEFWNVMHGERVVISRIEKERAERLAAQMGSGYEAKPESEPPTKMEGKR